MSELESQRQELVETLVEQIANQNWQRHCTGSRAGATVTGWGKRLSLYSWAAKDEQELVRHLISLHRWTVQAGHYPADEQAGMKLALEILEWGHVTRGNSSRVPSVLKDVVESARNGEVVDRAPMNSGWTKVAAVFAHEVPDAPPQVIWDSRVSLSACTRLGKAAQSHGIDWHALRAVFPGLGWVGGRKAGNREALREEARSWFPDGYRKWSAHFAGGQLVQEIADILNRREDKYGLSAAVDEEGLKMLEEDGLTALRQWNSWLVACVLFMDGR